MDAMDTDTLTRGQKYEAKKRESEAAAIERRTSLWLQKERIERYLPTLRLKREEAARHLQDLDELIRDEQAAVAEIREQVK